MGAFLELLRKISYWQWGLLTVSFFGSILFFYFLFNQLSDSTEKSSMNVNEEIYIVELGDVVIDVSTNGTLIFPNRTNIEFDVAGTVEQVFVEEGDEVMAGDLLAGFDSTTVSALKKNLATKEVNLDAEKENLNTLLQPDPLAVAQAEKTVSAAKLSLKQAKENLDEILLQDTLLIAQAESKIVQAELDLNNLKESLDILLNPSSLEIVKISSEIASLNIQIDDSKESLNALINPVTVDISELERSKIHRQLQVESLQDQLKEMESYPSEYDVAQSKNRVESSKVAVETAQLNLQSYKKELLGSVGTQKDTLIKQLNYRRDQLDVERDAYNAVFEKWLGITLAEKEYDVKPSILLKNWDIDLNKLFPEQSIVTLLPNVIPKDLDSTKWNETTVFSWLNLLPQNIRATCSEYYNAYGELPSSSEGVTVASVSGGGNRNLVDSRPCVILEMDLAWNELEPKHTSYINALDTLEEFERNYPNNLRTREHTLLDAENSLKLREEEYDEIIKGRNKLDIEQKKLEIDIAKIQLDELQDQINLLKNPEQATVQKLQVDLILLQARLQDAQDRLQELQSPDSLVVLQKQNQIKVAELQVTDAKKTLSDLLEEPDEMVVQDLEKQVNLSEAKLNEANTNLEEVKKGSQENLITLQEAEIDNLEQGVKELKDQLTKVNLKAPVTGVVASLDVEEGQAVAARKRIMDLVDTSVVEMQGVIDEIDVLAVKIGTKAEVTTDALPGQTLIGRVSFISVEPQSQQGVVVYPVKIEVSIATTEVKFKEGLSSTARIIVNEERNVLTIPERSIRGTFDNPFVKVLENNIAIEKPISLGLSDGVTVAVHKGLKEGDQIIFESEAVQSGPQWGGMGGMRRAVSGGGGSSR